MKRNISFSLLFAFLLGTLSTIDFAFNGSLYSICSLDTVKIFIDLEFWRLFTFQLFASSPEGLLLTLSTLLFIAPKIELFFGKRIFPMFIVLISFLVGATISIIFNEYQIIYGGAEGVSFFLIAAYLFIFIKDKMVPFKRQPSLNICLFIIALWITFKCISALNAEEIYIILPSVTAAIVGFIIGYLVHLQIKLVIKSYAKKSEQRIKPIDNKSIPTNQDLGYTIYSNPKFKELFVKPFVFNPTAVKTLLDENDICKYKYVLDEEDILNDILDKINAYGMSSLTPDENSFLLEYSQK